MSPEQCKALPADSRSDIYSLGATMYYCLTGHLPFQAESDLSILSMHLYTPARFPESCTVARDLQQLVLTCLEKEPK